MVQWQTQTEVSNLGFNLYGQQDDDWVLLNPEIIPAKGDSVVVVEYQYLAASGAKFIAISDIDALGEETLHGPFLVGQTYGSNSQRQIIDWQQAIERRALKREQRELERKEQMLERSRLRSQQRKLVGE